MSRSPPKSPRSKSVNLEAEGAEGTDGVTNNRSEMRPTIAQIRKSISELTSEERTGAPRLSSTNKGTPPACPTPTPSRNVSYHPSAQQGFENELPHVSSPSATPNRNVSYHPSKQQTFEDEPPYFPGSPGRNVSYNPSKQQTFEDEPPHLPSPPTSPLTYRSRAGSPRLSQGGSKIPTAEPSTWQHTDFAEFRQSPEYLEDKTFRPEASRFTFGRSQVSFSGNAPVGVPSTRKTGDKSYASMRAASPTATNSATTRGLPNSKDFPSGIELAISGIGLSADLSADVFGMGIDAATSTMSYSAVKDRSSSNTGRGYTTRCPQDFQKSTTRLPFGMKKEPARGGLGCKGSRIPQASPSKLGALADQNMESGRRMHHMSPSFPDKEVPMKPSPGDNKDHSHHHGHYHEIHEELAKNEKVLSALGHLSQFKKSPSYSRCKVTGDLDFLKVCCPKYKEGKKYPEIPNLTEDDIEELIKCEAQDVDSTWILAGEERQAHKKPCPKQEKAQMTVKALMQAQMGPSCHSQKDYTPLEHPDPEDISPQVAADMMFAQERGLNMEDCPQNIISSLYPDPQKPYFPEKSPRGSISVVDRSSKDQEEIVERSASVPSEGVSDSAYTRKMKEMGDDLTAQKSFDLDFAIGQSKREYVLVAQKPQRLNKVQYRGNTPSWFPGYLSAFPDEEGIKVVSSPSKLFHSAWVHSNPGNMPSGDVIVID